MFIIFLVFFFYIFVEIFVCFRKTMKINKREIGELIINGKIVSEKICEKDIIVNGWHSYKPMLEDMQI